MSTPLLATYFLPRHIQRQLSGLEHTIVNYMCLLFNQRKEVISYEAVQITPTLDTIATAVHSTRSVVSRCLQRINKLNIFQSIRRRKANGEYKVNTYCLGVVLLRMFRSYYGKKNPNKNHHLPFQSTVVNKEQDKDNYFSKIGLIFDVIRGKKTVEEVLQET